MDFKNFQIILVSLILYGFSSLSLSLLILVLGKKLKLPFIFGLLATLNLLSLALFIYSFNSVVQQIIAAI